MKKENKQVKREEKVKRTKREKKKKKKKETRYLGDLRQQKVLKRVPGVVEANHYVL